MLSKDGNAISTIAPTEMLLATAARIGNMFTYN